MAYLLVVFPDRDPGCKDQPAPRRSPTMAPPWASLSAVCSESGILVSAFYILIIYSCSFSVPSELFYLDFFLCLGEIILIKYSDLTASLCWEDVLESPASNTSGMTGSRKWDKETFFLCWGRCVLSLYLFIYFSKIQDLTMYH